MNALHEWIRGNGRDPAVLDRPVEPELRVGVHGPPLRRFGIHRLLLVVARSDPNRVRRVPAEVLTAEGYDEQGGWATLACPCGAEVTARAELAKCACERWYTLVGPGAVFVAYGDMPAPARS